MSDNILGATFWAGDNESVENSQKLAAVFDEPNRQRIICPAENDGKTFFCLPCALEFAYTAWQIKWADKLPPFSWNLPETEINDVLWTRGKWEIRISQREGRIFLPDFFPHYWLAIPLRMNHLEAPGGMTLRWKLPVEEKDLREIVVLYNGQLFLPSDLKS